MALNAATDERIKKKIATEINETDDEKIDVNIEIVKEWITRQPHLPQDLDRRILPFFIRGCKHDIERTKRKVDTYFTYRRTIPEFFQNRDPESKEILRASKQFKAFVLPDLTPDGARVTFHSFTNEPVEEFDPAALYKMLCMIGDVRMVEEPMISGDIFVFDVGHMTLTHVAKLATPLLKKILLTTQNAFPQRLREIHLINAPSHVDKVVTMFKFFMKPKMKNRWHIHTGIKSLADFIPREMLPSDYGGESKSSDAFQKEWLKKLNAYKTYFEGQENVMVDENKRQDKGSETARFNENNIFGQEGAFRRLNID
ncbi:unnamed protein product [Bemisia tabaci]|uniref:CRAL-TRIO domain-containing protein n=1 Tax=Bemisia tabaci TaxID=7038 RepID=A0A9P0A6P3_BEMTA|nr:PREDICTED: alpha-tocopherol transfer protein-like [Bemisia tabaci]CAH0384285.1 unnamed protein product [Bemisia tabaci]